MEILAENATSSKAPPLRNAAWLAFQTARVTRGRGGTKGVTLAIGRGLRVTGAWLDAFRNATRWPASTQRHLSRPQPTRRSSRRLRRAPRRAVRATSPPASDGPPPAPSGRDGAYLFGGAS
jgi:hypothetical protein